MTAQPFGQGNELLARISVGMIVVDAADERVGTVRRVYRGATDRHEATLRNDPALDAVPDDVPDALLARLAVSGYVAIATGTAHDERYALGEQVAALVGDTVRLAVGRDTLAKR